MYEETIDSERMQNYIEAELRNSRMKMFDLADKALDKLVSAFENFAEANKRS